MSLAWIDIDNPPQVQYLIPFKDELERRGHSVTVTARRHGITEELLRARGIDHTIVGAEAGKATLRKVTAIAFRAARLARVQRRRRPDLVLTTSRAGATAGRLLRRPVFTLIDYEFANLSVHRRAGCYILHPEAIDESVFVAKGFPRSKLLAFPGLKESISFAGVDLEAVEPHDFGTAAQGMPLLLFRPPAEQAHYFHAESADLSLSALASLARRDDLQVVFSPRYSHQVSQLSRFDWRVPPIVLDRPVPFVSLLRSVGAVMSSGGTMLREAAYLGVPAYSIFRSELGAVDRFLVERGLLDLVADASDVEHVEVRRGGGFAPAFPPGDAILAGLVTEMLGRA